MVFDRNPQIFLVAPSALAMSSQAFRWGSARKTSISEPVRLAYIQFSTAFVNGGHFQGQIRDKLDGFLIKKPSSFSRACLRRSRCLNPQDPLLYQIEKTIGVSYISTQPTILNVSPVSFYLATTFLAVCCTGCSAPFPVRKNLSCGDSSVR